MKLEKLFYIVASTILVTIFILFTFVFSPLSYEDSKFNKEKVIYYVDHISSAHRKVINLFNAKYRGQIRVKTINLSFDKFSTNERKDLLARYLRSKSNRIDLFTVDIIWVPRFTKWAKPLDSFFNSNFLKNILSHPLQTCYFRDSLFAIPLYTDIALMFYRKDILEKIPDYQKFKNELDSSITWERFIELKNKLDKFSQRKNKPFYIFQGDDYEGLMCSLCEIMGNYQLPVMDSSHKIYLNTDAGKKSIQLLVDLVHRYKLSPIEVTKLRENESYQFFAENDAFSVRGWPSFSSKDNKFVSEEIKNKIVKVPTPHISGKSPSLIFGGWNLMVSKYSEKIPEVIKFIEFLISPEAQKILYEEGGYLPINLKLYNDSTYTASHPDLIFYYNLFKKGVHRPLLEDYTNFSDLISFYLSEGIRENLSAEKIIEQIEKQLNYKLTF